MEASADGSDNDGDGRQEFIQLVEMSEEEYQLKLLRVIDLNQLNSRPTPVLTQYRCTDRFYAYLGNKYRYLYNDIFIENLIKLDLFRYLIKYFGSP